MKREYKLRDRLKKKNEGASGGAVGVNNKKHLNNIRVVQRNLVYVTNLALSAAKDEVKPQVDLLKALVKRHGNAEKSRTAKLEAYDARKIFALKAIEQGSGRNQRLEYI